MKGDDRTHTVSHANARARCRRASPGRVTLSRGGSAAVLIAEESKGPGPARRIEIGQCQPLANSKKEIYLGFETNGIAEPSRGSRAQGVGRPGIAQLVADASCP